MTNSGEKFGANTSELTVLLRYVISLFLPFRFYLSESRPFRSVVDLVSYFSRNSLKESFSRLDANLRSASGLAIVTFCKAEVQQTLYVSSSPILRARPMHFSKSKCHAHPDITSVSSSVMYFLMLYETDTFGHLYSICVMTCKVARLSCH